MAVVRGNAASILACVQVWYTVILPAPFLVALNVLATIAACRLPLNQCGAISFRILILSVRFIVPSVVQCYLVHWLNILSTAQPMMRVQCGVIFHIAWNLWGEFFFKCRRNNDGYIAFFVKCVTDNLSATSGLHRWWCGVTKEKIC